MTRVASKADSRARAARRPEVDGTPEDNIVVVVSVEPHIFVRWCADAGGPARCFAEQIPAGDDVRRGDLWRPSCSAEAVTGAPVYKPRAYSIGGPMLSKSLVSKFV